MKMWYTVLPTVLRADMEQALHQAGAHAVAAGSMFVYFGPLKAVLINVPEEAELYETGVYQRG